VLALARGVPCLPGYDGGADAQAQYDACFLAQAQRIGFPLMVKAAAGGGGRGMRLVGTPQELLPALASARSEAASAFGSGQLLLERALPDARHVEVQVFADALGNCIHLGERDCSVQRRHQKIIEETPSPAVDAALRDAMGHCAVALAQAAGYVGAGTVEFLLPAGPQPNSLAQGVEVSAFYLMEMNTRLQVEHPVTEAVTALDLVEWQLRVARGEPLPLTQAQLRFEGHAMEVRLCAEDERFTSHTGCVQHFRPPCADPPMPPHPHPHPDSAEPGPAGRQAGLRFDHAVYPGLVLTPFYDALLGKLIVHAPTREQAIDELAGALDRLQLLGVPTNRAFLAACLRHPLFRSGGALTSFLALHGDDLRAGLLVAERAALLPAAMAALFPQGSSRDLPPPFERPLRLRHRGERCALRVCEARGLVVEPAPAVRLPDGRWHVQQGGVDLFFDDLSLASPAGAAAGAGSDVLRAPFSGRLLALQVAPGAQVARGDILLVIESMKLEHALAAPRDGVVASVVVDAGQQLSTGQLLLSLAPEA